MKKKILALAIAGSLAVPQAALAAEDTAGMHYTSASEGFYASIRAQLTFTGNAENGAANLDGGSSRFGVSGTNDLGGGLEGFYTYEAGVDIANGGNLNTRVGQVGLRGGFGELRTGTFWDNSYNWTHGSTDTANVFSGYFTYNDNYPARVSNSIQYTSPDLNGFQVAVRGSFDRSRDGEGEVVFDSVNTNPKDDNDLDSWAISAKYSIQGFSLGATYLGRPDALATTTGRDDWNAWVIKGGYSQDNWYVNTWYTKDNASDGAAADDAEIFAVGGGVTVDKIALYGIYESQENSSAQDDRHFTLGFQYNLGAKTRAYIEYFGQDYDSSTSEDDDVVIGLRHDF